MEASKLLLSSCPRLKGTYLCDGLQFVACHPQYIAKPVVMVIMDAQQGEGGREGGAT